MFRAGNTLWMLLILFVLPTVAAAQTTWYVDDDNCPGPGSGTFEDPFCKIQQGLTTAAPGDTVIVFDGTYTGPKNRDLDFGGKAVILQSQNGPAGCIIDCEFADRAFTIDAGEGPDTVVSGLTIRNGYADEGGAVFCSVTSPSITGNVFTGNSCYSKGGAIHCHMASPLMYQNFFTDNDGGDFGGAISLYRCDNPGPFISMNTITGNRAEGAGGGVYCVYSVVHMEENIIEQNHLDHTYSVSGAGIYCEASTALITGNRIADNVLEEQHNYGSGCGIYCMTSPWIVIEGNIITGNRIEGDRGDGAGICCQTGSLVRITGNEITGNFILGEQGRGAGISCQQVEAAIIGNTIHGNTMSSAAQYDFYYGGGINLYDCPSVSIRENEITSNLIDVHYGGLGAGIHSYDTSPVITGNRISDNRIRTVFNRSYALGGGIYIQDDDHLQDPIIGGNMIVGNNAEGHKALGGGIYARDLDLGIYNNTIERNSTTASGGGIYFEGYSSRTLTVNNNLIRNNVAWALGGGICSVDYGRIDLFNDLITGNVSGTSGGVFARRATIRHCTIAGNEAVNDGAVHTMETAQLYDNIIQDNTPLDFSTDAWPPQAQYNNVGGGLPGIGNIDLDPLFASGPETDQYLSAIAAGQPADSPCVDAGSDQAENICFLAFEGSDGNPVSVCMNELSTRSTMAPDAGQVDMGYHSPLRTTLSVGLVATPPGGTLPLDTMFTATVSNFSLAPVQVAARVEATLANGNTYANYKSGTIDLDAGGNLVTSWSQQMPLKRAFLGRNIFHLIGEELPPPGVAPGGPPGTTDTDYCIVDGNYTD